MTMKPDPARYVVGLESVGRNDVARVGGKNASLGEMICGLQGKGVIEADEADPELGYIVPEDEPGVRLRRVHR